MSRHPDASSMGRSRRAPFVIGETPAERHARRLRVALSCRDALERWLAAHGLALRISHHDLHWRILRDGKPVVQWWPSTAKAVVGERWTKGVHCHDVDQLRELIARRVLAAQEKPGPSPQRLERALRRERIRTSAAVSDSRRAPPESDETEPPA